MLRKIALSVSGLLVVGVAAHRLVPGALGHGVTLLPSGWRIAPAGRQIPVGNLPLNLLRLANGQVVVTLNGHGANGLWRIDPGTGRVVDSLPLRAAWLGLAHRGTAAADTVWASGGSTNRVYRVIYGAGAPAVDSAILATPPTSLFTAGIAVLPGRDLVAVVGNLSDSVYILDTRSLAVTARLAVGHRPYTAVADAGALYVSNWGDSTIERLPIGANGAADGSKLEVGPHPSSLVLRGRQLFATLAGANAVAQFDLDSGRVTDRLAVALMRGAPVGSDPDALALSPDGHRLFVALAGNNAVAVVNVASPTPAVEGLLPVGWYPTGVEISGRGDTLYVANGKGDGSGPNPSGPYIADLVRGSLSVIPLPDAAGLAAATATVTSLSPYSNPGLRQAPPDLPGVHHVVYVIRENRTYDQVLGDIKRGNGDPKLAIFNDSVTPNAHALTRRFVLFDNFYVDGEVSADGHEWTDRAFAGEYNEKTWPAIYSNRRDWDVDDGSDLANPHGAYLWDAARRAGLWTVNFGEAVHVDSEGGRHVSTMPGLQGITVPEFPGFELGIRDTTRARLFADSVNAWDQRDTFPALVILYLPRDHTEGKRALHPSPRAMVADNDLALGQVVERLSRSKAWKSMAFFALEDDAQDGPDHVDAHRSVLIMASPFARHGIVDSTMYSTSSVVRTIGIFLGLPPLSQYDAGATPLTHAFETRPDLTPFRAVAARWPFDELNAKQSMSRLTDQDFAGPDLADETVLNQEIWQSVRGREPVPAPRRTYLAGHTGDGDGDDR
ncbi:MAG TPA: bifunctional YncE family protein/alkaline phosphatase family protein [Gemmatimonadales bacterium]|nr:bifunctional YncE family protein/alkaline phosphatase family protein [Gemmatimonadales bacterium]